MKKLVILAGIFLFISCGRGNLNKVVTQHKEKVQSFTEIKSLFKKPPVNFRSAPLWVWNDDVTEAEIDRQLTELQSAGIGGVFIHPRPGLITPYLSEKWFALTRHTVDKAKKLGMEVWLYDENSYPSGFAGGHVPAEMPASYNQGQGLKLHRFDKLPKDTDRKYFLALKKEGKKFVDITSRLNQEKNKKGDYYLFEKTFYGKSPWFGGYSYVDLLYEGVTEKFLDVTMTNGYEKAIGDEFGKIVPGIFTDEPNISPPGGIRWTPSLFDDFEKRWGYDLKTNLPSLFYETGDWRRIRHNYYALLLEMFIDRWSKPYHQYCAEHDLKWTGHYWEHGWPIPAHGPDNMAMYAWHQMPAIDILMNQYREDVHAQFGNARAVKELRSAANQIGQARTLSETYGAGGWDLRFEDMKRIGDWEYVLGVNFLNQHLSYITIKGARKRDHPQSFSYHEPWFKYYKVLGDYFARLSLALSAGEQVNRVLVLEPTTTAWMYFSPRENNRRFSDLGAEFQKFVLQLEKFQVEYDLGSENIIANNSKIRGKQFVVGKRSYDLLILPPGLENLDQTTAALIEQYLQNGGEIQSFAAVPPLIDGVQSAKMNMLAKQFPRQWHNIKSDGRTEALRGLATDEIRFASPEKIKGKLFHHRRQLTDGDLLFLVNTDLANWSAGKFTIPGKSVLELNPVTGETLAYPVQGKGEQSEVAFDLPPAGSLLLFIGKKLANETVTSKHATVEIVPPAGQLAVRRITPNVLTLDYCDVAIGDSVTKDIYFFKAADKIYRHFGFDGNPWSRAVQYNREILDRDHFPENSRFEADFFFDVKKGVDLSLLRAVVERPQLWQLACNGKIVTANAGESWLDRSFGVFDIGEHVVVGRNRLTLIAPRMTIHSELEPVYILGDFGLRSQEKGWKMVAAAPLQLGSWKKQKMPFYSDGVSYSGTYRLNGEDKRYVVKLTDWRGSVAEVRVNGKQAGIIAWAPYELDVTKWIKNGENEVVVTVYGSLKNLLGPHHKGQIRGTAWPASFESAPQNQPAGSEYDFIDYGLFDDFVLLESEGPPQRVYWRNE